ncbi:hypothetical protein EW146_g5142 [Bondarzewia mesenterica]|uniref:Uncharacterized protein n=1 Tax=Bondarzewia mesenterica TaxID=1095465 RepID=A0A4S4LSF7_9AGAM|nr:hypothetical protein EW146_g5142 [Bondarzewia mesenterica]
MSIPTNFKFEFLLTGTAGPRLDLGITVVTAHDSPATEYEYVAFSIASADPFDACTQELRLIRAATTMAALIALTYSDVAYSFEPYASNLDKYFSVSRQGDGARLNFNYPQQQNTNPQLNAYIGSNRFSHAEAGAHLAAKVPLAPGASLNGHAGVDGSYRTGMDGRAGLSVDAKYPIGEKLSRYVEGKVTYEPNPDKGLKVELSASHQPDSRNTNVQAAIKIPLQ